MTALFGTVFTVLVVQRLLELRVSRDHEARLRARGAREAGAAHYPWMIAVHAAWFVAWLVELSVFGARAWWGSAPLAWIAVCAEALRWWAIRTLGDRWTTRVLVLPDASPITGGPYRWLRHPNYTAVFVQLVALPLVFGAWRAALFGALAYALVLRFRIRAENAAWAGRGVALPVPGACP
jgi:methyltransferase